MIAFVLLASVALNFDEPVLKQPFQRVPEGNPEVVVPARHLNLGETVQNDDYPLEALRRDEAGTAAFILSIDDQGRVLDCRIESSSGSTELDGQTCRLYRERPV